MAFQFTCPNGHLLSTDESQVGQQCQCPHCGTMFVIPPPANYQAPFAPAPFSPPQYGGFPTPAPPTYGQPSPPPGMMPSAAPPTMPADLLSELPAPEPSLPAGGSFGGPAAFGDAMPELLHIPCPNGHELETPQDMLGQHVMCPFCQAQFVLAYEQSIEFKKRKEAEQEALDARRGQLWFRWAIAFAVLVLLGLVALIVIGNR